MECNKKFRSIHDRSSGPPQAQLQQTANCIPAHKQNPNLLYEQNWAEMKKEFQE